MRREDAIKHVVLSGDYTERFPGWLHAHWNVFEEFERMAKSAINRGRERLSAKFLFEMIRWNTPVREDGAIYKVNNTHAADCARLFDHMNPKMAGAFEFRTRAKT